MKHYVDYKVGDMVFRIREETYNEILLRFEEENDEELDEIFIRNQSCNKYVFHLERMDQNWFWIGIDDRDYQIFLNISSNGIQDSTQETHSPCWNICEDDYGIREFSWKINQLQNLKIVHLGPDDKQHSMIEIHYDDGCQRLYFLFEDIKGIFSATTWRHTKICL